MKTKKTEDELIDLVLRQWEIEFPGPSIISDILIEEYGCSESECEKIAQRMEYENLVEYPDGKYYIGGQITPHGRVINKYGYLKFIENKSNKMTDHQITELVVKNIKYTPKNLVTDILKPNGLWNDPDCNKKEYHQKIEELVLSLQAHGHLEITGGLKHFPGSDMQIKKVKEKESRPIGGFNGNTIVGSSVVIGNGNSEAPVKSSVVDEIIIYEFLNELAKGGGVMSLNNFIHRNNYEFSQEQVNRIRLDIENYAAKYEKDVPLTYSFNPNFLTRNFVHTYPDLGHYQFHVYKEKFYNFLTHGFKSAIAICEELHIPIGFEDDIVTTLLSENRVEEMHNESGTPNYQVRKKQSNTNIPPVQLHIGDIVGNHLVGSSMVIGSGNKVVDRKHVDYSEKKEVVNTGGGPYLKSEGNNSPNKMEAPQKKKFVDTIMGRFVIGFAIALSVAILINYYTNSQSKKEKMEETIQTK